MADRHIVITIGRLERGGAELRLLRLIEDASARGGVQIHLYVVSGAVGALTPNFSMPNVSIIYGAPGFWGLARFFYVLRCLRPAVAHCNAGLAGGFYTFAAWLARVPIRISHIRTSEDYSGGLTYKLKKPVYRLLLNAFSTIVVGVCDGARRLSNTPARKWLTVYNGIDLEHAPMREQGLRNHGRLVVMGRMHQAKNQIFAVEVLHALVSRYADTIWSLDFYGKEDWRIKDEIQREAEARGIGNRIGFRGLTENPMETLRNYSVLLLPSVREGLPGVVLEAGAVGVPSVCSPLPGCVEIADRFRFSRIAQLGDPNSWADEVANIVVAGAKEVCKEFRSCGFDFETHKNRIYELWGVRS